MSDAVDVAVYCWICFKQLLPYMTKQMLQKLYRIPIKSINSINSIFNKNPNQFYKLVEKSENKETK